MQLALHVVLRSHLCALQPWHGAPCLMTSHHPSPLSLGCSHVPCPRMQPPAHPKDCSPQKQATETLTYFTSAPLSPGPKAAAQETAGPVVKESRRDEDAPATISARESLP